MSFRYRHRPRFRSPRVPAGAWAAAVLLLVTCAERPAATTVDDLGRAVAVPPAVTRIVTLAPNVTEIAYAIGAGSKIAGTDDASDYPAPVRELPKVGAMRPNVEKIVALRPDLVLASTEGNPPSLATSLGAVGIPLFVVRTDRLAEIPRAMRRLGALLDAPLTEAAAGRLERDVEAQRRTRPSRPRVLFLVWTDPLYVAGRATFTDDLFELTGVRNAVALDGWPQYSLESLAQSPPDLLLYPRGAVSPEQVEALLKRVRGMKCQVVAVEEDIFQRPGPRMAQAAAALNTILDASMPAGQSSGPAQGGRGSH